MTNEQINQRIAEACGWTEIKNCVWRHHKPWGYPPLKAGQGGNAFKMLPNYCNDLNAMHEAEKMLNREQSDDYIARLFDACAEATLATARQRAEAFLRTLGKWDQSGDATEMEDQA